MLLLGVNDIFAVFLITGLDPAAPLLWTEVECAVSVGDDGRTTGREEEGEEENLTRDDEG